jgi:hypothetical protein
MGPGSLDTLLDKVVSIVQRELDRWAIMTPQQIREEMTRFDVTGDVGDPEGTPLVRRLGEVATRKCPMPEDWFVSVSRRGKYYYVSVHGPRPRGEERRVRLPLPKSVRTFEVCFRGYGYPDLLDRMDM